MGGWERGEQGVGWLGRTGGEIGSMWTESPQEESLLPTGSEGYWGLGVFLWLSCQFLNSYCTIVHSVY